MDASSQMIWARVLVPWRLVLSPPVSNEHQSILVNTYLDIASTARMKAIECPYCVHKMSPKMDVNKGFIRCPSCKDEFTWPLGGRRKSNFKKRKKPKPQSVSNTHEERFMWQDINIPTARTVLLFLIGCIGPYLPTGFGLWLLDEFGGNMDWGMAILLWVLLLGLIPFTMAAFILYGIKTKRTGLASGTVLSAILLFGWVSYGLG